jgi:transcriptional regulator with XRE-family HTH domain
VGRRADGDIKAAFGHAVRELRLERGLSQEALAERAGLHRTYVGGIEQGRRNPALLAVERLARGLGVSMADLIGRAEAQRGVTEGALPTRLIAGGG